jgi:hypothetical protein
LGVADGVAADGTEGASDGGTLEAAAALVADDAAEGGAAEAADDGAGLGIGAGGAGDGGEGEGEDAEFEECGFQGCWVWEGAAGRREVRRRWAVRDSGNTDFSRGQRAV